MRQLQWCTGAPGIVISAADYLDEELLLAGAELVWQAGPHGDEKGYGICHGTAGNGYAQLKTFGRTGDERWLNRARRFAVHALEQAERLAGDRGHRRYSLGPEMWELRSTPPTAWMQRRVTPSSTELIGCELRAR